jgi:hypothetical protein
VIADSASNQVAVLLNDGAGGFPVGGPTPFPALASLRSVETGDFDGDGNPDVVAVALSDVAILFGDGAGGLSLPFSLGFGSLALNARAGDFNQDGRLDLAITDNSNNQIAILLNDSVTASNFTSPPADFSTLVKNPDESYTRTLKDGTLQEFDAAGPGRQRAGLVGHRQTLLEQSRHLLFAQPLAPAGQRRALEGLLVLEALLAAEELVIGVLQPARAQGLVREVVHMLEDQKARHQPARQGWLTGPGAAHRAETPVDEAPVDLLGQTHQGMAQVHNLI